MRAYHWLRKDSIRISLAFCFAFLSALVIPAIWPLMRLTYFAPFLVILYYKKPFLACLWFSLACGLLMDMMGSYQHMGLYALNYCMTTWILFRQTQHFFEDRVSTLPVMTFFFAVISTAIQAVMLVLFEKGVAWSGGTIITDFMLLPIADAVYAYVLFTLPRVFMPRFPRREYFMNRKPVKK